MKEMKVRRSIGVAIAIMVLLAVSAVPAIACLLKYVAVGGGIKVYPMTDKYPQR